MRRETSTVVWILLAFVLVKGIFGLKDVHIVIPTAVIRGDNAILRCHYDLEGDPLYAVKWYKGRREFYRYTPRESPPIKVFPLNGLTVKKDDSNDTHVLLENVSNESSGEYSCEISADAPSFFTRIETGMLSVVDLPSKDLTIEGLKVRYRVGDVIRANCTTGESRPAPTLKWYVNGRRLDEQHHVYQRHRSRMTENGPLERAHSALRLPVTKQLFQKGRLKIRCAASIHDVYYRSFEKSVELEKKKHKTHIVRIEGRYTTEGPPAHFDLEYEALPAERQPDMTLTFRSQSSDSLQKLTSLFCVVVSVLSVLCTR